MDTGDIGGSLPVTKMMQFGDSERGSPAKPMLMSRALEEKKEIKIVGSKQKFTMSTQGYGKSIDAGSQKTPTMNTTSIRKSVASGDGQSTGG